MRRVVEASLKTSWRYLRIMRVATELLKRKENLMNGAGKKALDVGCGSGDGLRALEYLGYNVYGCDVNPTYINGLIKSLGGNVRVCDVCAGIPFDDNFDLITCIEVLEHLDDPFVALRNMRNHLAPGGVLVLTTPNLYTEWLRCFLLYSMGLKRTKGVFRDQSHINVKSPSQWSKHIKGIFPDLQPHFTNITFVWFRNHYVSIRSSVIGFTTLIVLRNSSLRDDG